jgi:hypothetical protein
VLHGATVSTSATSPLDAGPSVLQSHGALLSVATDAHPTGATPL